MLREFLRCGLWCSECRRSLLVACSCRGRSFCPSCEKKRQLLWAEWLCREVLAQVDHRHVVLTVLYRSRMNPSLGRNFEAMDPLE